MGDADGVPVGCNEMEGALDRVGFAEMLGDADGALEGIDESDGDSDG